MTKQLETLSWPISRLGEGIEQLARRAGLNHIQQTQTAVIPNEIANGDIDELGRWIAWASERLGLEAEAIESPISDFDKMIKGAGPAIFHDRSGGISRFWLLLCARGSTLTLIGPDIRLHRCPADNLRQLLCGAHETPIADEIEQLLDTVGLPRRRRERVRTALLRERLCGQRLENCWILRLPPETGFWRQLSHARLPRRLTAIIGVFASVYGLELLGWSVIGRGALDGRLDVGWLSAWALLILSMIPLQSLGHWLEATFALDIGRLLKQRLLSGAMRMNLETIRQQGAGQLLSRVIESQALESLALNGGLSVLVALLELSFAGVVIALGAGGQLQLFLLFAAVLATVGLSWRHFRRLRRATLTRLDMTHDLVERMVGHRTCLAQESHVRREQQQDHDMESYLGISKAMDASGVALSLMPRAWLIVGLMGLAPAFIAGTVGTIELAIGLGGMLLAERALSGFAGGFAALARAGIAWKQVAPLFHAASRKSVTPSFMPQSPLTTQGTQPANTPLIDASDLVFHYRPHGEPVLRSADLVISHGDRVLLEGSSGGGKSTLAALLVGLRKPDSGLLLLNGLDRHTLGDAWHGLATSAPQFHENHIFTGTLAFNLLMGGRWPASEADLEEAEQLCLELELGDLLDCMPSRMMQMVGETGWQLSHGERSRIFLARALLQNAPLTVLDESFAALDPKTLEKCLNCALKRASTLLVIAHP